MSSNPVISTNGDSCLMVVICFRSAFHFSAEGLPRYSTYGALNASVNCFLTAFLLSIYVVGVSLEIGTGMWLDCRAVDDDVLLVLSIDAAEGCRVRVCCGFEMMVNRPSCSVPPMLFSVLTLATVRKPLGTTP